MIVIGFIIISLFFSPLFPSLSLLVAILQHAEQQQFDVAAEGSVHGLATITCPAAGGQSVRLRLSSVVAIAFLADHVPPGHVHQVPFARPAPGTKRG